MLGCNGSAEDDLRRLRRTAVTLLCLLIFLAPDPVGAAEVAILTSADLAAYNQAVAGFKAAMPPSTTFIEYDMQGNMARGRKLARKIRASDATLLLAVGVKAALVSKLEIVDIPVVFCMVLDPARHDLNAPNMTGIRLDVPIERQFKTMRSVLPPVKRLGVLYDPEKTGNLVQEARLMAKAMGFELIEREVRTGKDLPAVLRAIVPQIQALWLVPDSTVLTEDSLKFVMDTTLDSNVPVVGFSSELVRSGALVGLSVRYEDVGRQAGALARKILSEQARPSTSMFPPERLRLSLNLKTARFLGIVIPSDVVSNADELY
jgi:putative ABC transport system substrate-binding protein